jgi:hypothetical protein
MKNSGKFVICDRGNERSRMQIFTKHGHFVRQVVYRYFSAGTALHCTVQGERYGLMSLAGNEIAQRKKIKEYEQKANFEAFSRRRFLFLKN